MSGKKTILQACLLFATAMLIAGIAQGAESPYKIRIGFPSLAFSYMPYYVAQEKGFFKKYDIESEYIQMTNSIAAASRGRGQYQLLHLGFDRQFPPALPDYRWSWSSTFATFHRGYW